MKELTYEQLISPYPLYINGIGYLEYPTLEKIFRLEQTEVGGNIYYRYLNLLSIDPCKWFEIMGKEDVYNSLSDNEKAELNIFDIFTLNNGSVQLLLNCLSFFMQEKLIYDLKSASFVTSKSKFDGNKMTESINRENFDYLCKLIMQINYLDSFKDEIKEFKPKNKKAEEIFNKLKKGEQEKKVYGDTSKNELTLANMISAFCVQSNSYDMTNVWSLTVYQLYDQFFRQNIKYQVDISSMRWAAWGKDNFDFDIWYKSNIK